MKDMISKKAVLEELGKEMYLQHQLVDKDNKDFLPPVDDRSNEIIDEIINWVCARIRERVEKL